MLPERAQITNFMNGPSCLAFLCRATASSLTRQGFFSCGPTSCKHAWHGQIKLGWPLYQDWTPDWGRGWGGGELISFPQQLQPGFCISVLGVLWHSTTDLVAQNRRNVISHSSGDQECKPRCQQSHALPEGAKRECSTPFSQRWRGQHPLAFLHYRRIPPISASDLHRRLPVCPSSLCLPFVHVCLCVSSLLLGTPVILN